MPVATMTLAQFYVSHPGLPEGDQELVKAALATMSYPTEDESTSSEVLADVGSLGAAKFEGRLPQTLSIRQIAAMEWFAQNPVTLENSRRRLAISRFYHTLFVCTVAHSSLLCIICICIEHTFSSSVRSVAGSFVLTPVSNPNLFLTMASSHPGSAAHGLAAAAVQTATAADDQHNPDPREFTITEFYGHSTHLPQGDMALVKESFIAMGYPANDDSPIREIYTDVDALGLSRFTQRLPAALGIRQVAALERFLKNLGLEEVAAITPGDDRATDSPAVRQALRAAGVNVDAKAAEEERIRHRATVGKLANDLQLGMFAPLLLPDKELLTKATAAAQIGHFPDFGNLYDEKHDRPFAKGLLNILQSGVAGLLQHRLTPAALLSELAVVLELALEPRLRQVDAEKVAINYAMRGRKLLHEASLNVHMVPSDPQSYQNAMNLFLRRDMGLYAETKEALGVEPLTESTAPRARVGRNQNIVAGTAPAMVQKSTACAL